MLDHMPGAFPATNSASSSTNANGATASTKHQDILHLSQKMRLRSQQEAEGKSASSFKPPGFTTKATIDDDEADEYELVYREQCKADAEALAATTYTPSDNGNLHESTNENNAQVDTQLLPATTYVPPNHKKLDEATADINTTVAD